MELIEVLSEVPYAMVISIYLLVRMESTLKHLDKSINKLLTICYHIDQEDVN